MAKNTVKKINNQISEVTTGFYLEGISRLFRNGNVQILKDKTEIYLFEFEYNDIGKLHGISVILLPMGKKIMFWPANKIYEKITQLGKKHSNLKFSTNEILILKQKLKDSIKAMNVEEYLNTLLELFLVQNLSS